MYKIRVSGLGQLIHKIFKVLFSFELLFILYLFAGIYKADPRFQWVPVDLTALFFVLSLVTSFFVMFRNKFKIKLRSWYLVLFGLVFIAYVLLSWTWTPGYFYAREKVFKMVVLTSWALIAPALIISSNIQRVYRFFVLLAVFSSLVAAESFINYLLCPDMEFITAFGSNYLGVSRIIGLSFLVICGYLLFLCRSKLNRCLITGVLIFYVWILLSAGGRGPVLAVVLAGLILLLAAFRISDGKVLVRKSVLYPILMLVICLFAVAFLISSKHFTTTIYRFLVLLEPGMGKSAGTRLYYYVTSLNMFSHNLIWGYGVGSWPVIAGLGDFRLYPHNIILEIAVEFGSIGLFAFACLVAYPLISHGSWRKIRKDPVLVIILSMFVFTFINALVSGDISDNRVMFSMIGLMAFKRDG